ncbi:cation diffusion facilitator family transporter [Cerasibacillus quisquiliarum]|mgnify:FL=1|uniref:Cation transporter n=1 Tax=Cerasibacillus quisquiliarum TaxID=227865 RepID=A0A511UTI2_9BACI|nr:cation diffusion facilitator family transporter [Cerasibacillus quisquiliarum]MBB5145216.1 cation diffusion facilitator family transporter [Cerasibacillus quisquiliarum]GEN29894.1 cation transporter [Cerasibacillus quisquiliarum]
MKKNTKKIVFATWIGITVNVMLTILKGIGGFLSGSKALIADAIHSASDIISSVIVLFGVRIANKPPDEEHPYGHGKAENIASNIIALILIVVGIEMSISSFKVFLGDMPKAPTRIALIILIISVIMKELLFQYKYYVGKKYNSAALISDAWHHRSDSLSSIAALLGVSAAMLSDTLQLPLLVYGDAVAGILVSIIVIKVGYDLVKESSTIMLEKVLTKDETKKYIETIHSIEGVLVIDQLYARTHGSYIIIDIKVAVDPSISVKAGHDIAKKLKQTLMAEHKEVADVLVHLNPYFD